MRHRATMVGGNQEHESPRGCNHPGPLGATESPNLKGPHPWIRFSPPDSSPAVAGSGERLHQNATHFMLLRITGGMRNPSSIGPAPMARASATQSQRLHPGRIFRRPPKRPALPIRFAPTLKITAASTPPSNSPLRRSAVHFDSSLVPAPSVISRPQQRRDWISCGHRNRHTTFRPWRERPP